MKMNTDGILMTMKKSNRKVIYCDRCHNELMDEFTYISPVLAGWVPKGCYWNGVKMTYKICQPCVRSVGNLRAVEDVEEAARLTSAEEELSKKE